MLFFDRRRRMRRLLSQDEFKSSADSQLGSPFNSPFESQATTPAESDCGRNSMLQSPGSKTPCARCSSYACRWFPSLSLADWIMLQLIMGALLLAAMSGVVCARLVSIAENRFDFDAALLTRDLYFQAKDYFQRSLTR